ncbi:hypothetical protein [Ureibacillus chungkukjangi]|uniref:Uncharacterized protein n=1 Tax=Ureibacillus chungkukjangi TaxID=1202712 RepID=A0A318THJ7_9BACL|nr:hypothetical protein [Ureibacillus chungkukjangi]PYF03943.1 hypothetical protein BJ095_12717 [Ureibacillus chungkukjangi]
MTWNQLHKEQEEVFIQLKRIEKLNKQKENLTEQLTHIKREIDNYNLELKEIRKKLQHLDSFSFINLIQSWTGKQEELRAQKIDKAAILELKMNEAEKMKEDLTNDLVLTTSELQKSDQQKLNNKLELLIAKKQIWLKEFEPDKALKLQQLEEEELNCSKLKIEIEEARATGKDAIRILSSTLKVLDSASNYSTWDTFLGGGLLATHLKHEKIDESKNKMHQAQIALQRFKNELLDIQEMSTRHLTINTDGFVKFADYFFDDIFSAWSTHTKITSSKEHISRVLSDVRNTILKIEQKLQLVEQKQIELIKQKNSILMLNK